MRFRDKSTTSFLLPGWPIFSFFLPLEIGARLSLGRDLLRVRNAFHIQVG